MKTFLEVTMKKILLTLALVASAHADTLAVLKNEAGGVIVLTDIQSGCRNYPGAVYATTSKSNNTFWGCWYSDDFMVHINWNDGARTSYLIDHFTIDPDKVNRWRDKFDRQKYD